MSRISVVIKKKGEKNVTYFCCNKRNTKAAVTHFCLNEKDLAVVVVAEVTKL